MTSSHYFLCLDNKKSYEKSIGSWFVDSRLTTEQRGGLNTHFENSKYKSSGEKILVSFLKGLKNNTNTAPLIRIVI